MNIAPRMEPAPRADLSRQLRDTQDAFDSVAPVYDGPRGNNAVIRDMRARMWRWLDATFAPGSRLLDLGCGTGLDAVRMAQHGHHVTATDWSPRMVERARERAAQEHVSERVEAVVLGAHELQRLTENGGFDGAYSNLGALNCVPDPAKVAQQCARLLKPGGALIFSVIGRLCPWEIAYYVGHGKWRRAAVRFARRTVPVGLNRRVVWTRYYTPRQFCQAFRQDFTLEHCRGLCLFAPPPYLVAVRERHPRLYQFLWRLEERSAGWPVLRNLGDHFLVVLRKRGGVP